MTLFSSKGMLLTEMDIEEAWKQMNSLLGKKIYATSSEEKPAAQDGLKKSESEMYILTPEEATIYLDLRLGPNSFANPDPRSEDALAIFRNEHKELEAHRTARDNQPRYWLARPVLDTSRKPSVLEVWIDHALLKTPWSDLPMQRIGDVEGIPLVFYNYCLHSGLMSYRRKDNLGLLARMSRVGMTLPERPFLVNL
jgi:hypothetical protein